MSYRAGLLIAFGSMLFFVGAAQSASVHPHVQQHCVQDYKKFCH